MRQDDVIGQLPQGFGMALAQNMDAMTEFGRLSKESQTKLIDKARNISSKRDMERLVLGILPENRM